VLSKLKESKFKIRCCFLPSRAGKAFNYGGVNLCPLCVTTVGVEMQGHFVHQSAGRV
jgi:hypothetical protein